MPCKQCNEYTQPNFFDETAEFCSEKCRHAHIRARTKQRRIGFVFWGLLFALFLYFSFSPAKAADENTAIIGKFTFNSEMSLCETQVQATSVVTTLIESGHEVAEELYSEFTRVGVCKTMAFVGTIVSLRSTEVDKERKPYYIVKVFVIGIPIPRPPFIGFFDEPRIRFGFTMSRPVPLDEYLEHGNNQEREEDT